MQQDISVTANMTAATRESRVTQLPAPAPASERLLLLLLLWLHFGSTLRH